MAADTMAYAAYCTTCGHLAAAIVDLPELREESADMVADCIRIGLRVERVTCAVVREAAKDMFCECPKSEPVGATDGR